MLGLTVVERTEIRTGATLGGWTEWTAHLAEDLNKRGRCL